jgi:predicted DNA binding protein
MRLLDDALTERQRDILATAYYSGYFDQQRKQTGAEIADLLGISQPAFSTQLRAAQRNLFSPIFDQESG